MTHFIPLLVVSSSQALFLHLTSLGATLALPKSLSWLSPSIINQMPVHFSLQQDEVQKQRQGVVFDIWICEFEAFTLSLTL